MIDSVPYRYANALLLLAEEENKVLEYQKSVKIVLKVIESNPDLITFLKLVSIDDVAKRNLVKKVFEESNVNANVVNFICLVSEKKRVKYLKKIFDCFDSLCNEIRGIKEGIIYSVEPLTAEQIEEIEFNISLKVQSKVELENKINKNLLGGIKVVVDDKIFDNTIYRKMQVMYRQLMLGKEGKK